MVLPAGLGLPCPCLMIAADGHLWGFADDGPHWPVYGVDRSCGHPVTARLGYRSMPPIWCENANTSKCICESSLSCSSYAAHGYAVALRGERALWGYVLEPGGRYAPG